ncbi:TPA: DUF2591 family protein [Enterobacter cloacae]|uniref:DUF2591 domain-containing protein n=1 Tax=Enterobacter cloacae TaxID=550 RepID=UPI00211C8345|nr:DUF2591 domain-containing protein [Enterobacter cloacae]MCQ9484392.1 DUF2591 domain-containing protein [Enterobacter cloacae]MCQ9527440.1 DUF2591 domain-containing protein [Enterobacter cloacae]MCQ9570085.1 DUF2591 domain-containing protein [Enterobacter cloacae]HCD7173191.1 DUF2591 family protein [Enterobacter cloacae]HDC4657857.1 DUF2591 family protein [Enterobacter cloacae]
MDYSQLSDFEINKCVSVAAGLNVNMSFDVDEVYARGPVWTAPSGNFYAGIKSSKGNPFDPCNNPADAWPIIVDNEISLNSYSGTWEASYEYDAPIGAFGTDELVTKAVEGKNPLRTAMIAFLMKREHANA